jgi:hypothetical protein
VGGNWAKNVKTLYTQLFLTFFGQSIVFIVRNSIFTFDILRGLFDDLRQDKILYFSHMGFFLRTKMILSDFNSYIPPPLVPPLRRMSKLFPKNVKSKMASYTGNTRTSSKNVKSIVYMTFFDILRILSLARA